MPTGYSKTQLPKKLGIKPGHTVLPVYPPISYRELLGEFPEGIQIVDENHPDKIDFIHLFAKDDQALIKQFPLLKSKMGTNGMIWVSWIKKSSALSSNVVESDVRSMGLELGLVDVKICAINEDWSGLKFVYRTKDR